MGRLRCFKNKTSKEKFIQDLCVQKKRINYNLVRAESAQKALSELGPAPSLLTFKNALFIQNHMAHPAGSGLRLRPG